MLHDAQTLSGRWKRKVAGNQGSGGHSTKWSAFPTEAEESHLCCRAPQSSKPSPCEVAGCGCELFGMQIVNLEFAGSFEEIPSWFDGKNLKENQQGGLQERAKLQPTGSIFKKARYALKKWFSFWLDIANALVFFEIFVQVLWACRRRS